VTPPGPPIRSYLYVAGSDSRRIEKALASEADAVVIDLEDAVAPDRKDEARRIAAGVLETENTRPVFVRINAPGSALRERDVEAVAGPNLYGLRLPKTESAEDVRSVAEKIEELGCEAGIQCLIESALGLEMSFEIARAHPRVMGLGPGEADLAADLGVSGEEGLLYARSRIVSASRAAGLPAPVQSVYTNVRDLDGLRRSTAEGKRLGFLGRSAIHPDQIPVINEIFTPTQEEMAEAEDLLGKLKSASASGTGAFALEDGRFVDEAVVRAARATLALARPARMGQEAR
jgi:citrate lyase subunit beta / citryl-CoA lyase